MFGHMRRYEEMRLQREKRKNQASFAAGATLGLIAGYCAKKYLAPKLSEIEVKSIVEKETQFIKEKFEDLKSNVISLKDRFGFDACCCCCDDECCEDGSCEDGCCECEPDEEAETSEPSPEEPESV